MSKESGKIIVRYKKPGRYDKAPFNTLCQIVSDDEINDLQATIPDMYLQINKDSETDAIWIPAGDALIGAYLHRLMNEADRLIIIIQYLEYCSKKSLSE